VATYLVFVASLPYLTILKRGSLLLCWGGSRPQALEPRRLLQICVRTDVAVQRHWFTWEVQLWNKHTFMQYWVCLALVLVNTNWNVSLFPSLEKWLRRMAFSPCVQWTSRLCCSVQQKPDEIIAGHVQLCPGSVVLSVAWEILISSGLRCVPCLACPRGSIPKCVLAASCELQPIIYVFGFGNHSSGGNAFPSNEHQFSQNLPYYWFFCGDNWRQGCSLFAMIPIWHPKMSVAVFWTAQTVFRCFLTLEKQPACGVGAGGGAPLCSVLLCCRALWDPGSAKQRAVVQSDDSKYLPASWLAPACSLSGAWLCFLQAMLDFWALKASPSCSHASPARVRQTRRRAGERGLGQGRAVTASPARGLQLPKMWLRRGPR